jgi:hypothetical protein
VTDHVPASLEARVVSAAVEAAAFAGGRWEGPSVRSEPIPMAAKTVVFIPPPEG